MTTQQTQQEIINGFRGKKDWMSKYARFMELGKTLPAIDEKYKTDDNLVKGCQVRTWFGSVLKDGRIYYRIDSMSLIIKGAIALLLKVLDGQKPEDVKDIDLYFIDKTGLRELFSPIKANSLWKVVSQMQTDAINFANKK